MNEQGEWINWEYGVQDRQSQAFSHGLLNVVLDATHHMTNLRTLELVDEFSNVTLTRWLLKLQPCFCMLISGNCMAIQKRVTPPSICNCHLCMPITFPYRFGVKKFWNFLLQEKALVQFSLKIPTFISPLWRDVMSYRYHRLVASQMLSVLGHPGWTFPCKDVNNLPPYIVIKTLVQRCNSSRAPSCYFLWTAGRRRVFLSFMENGCACPSVSPTKLSSGAYCWAAEY